MRAALFAVLASLLLASGEGLGAESTRLSAGTAPQPAVQKPPATDLDAEKQLRTVIDVRHLGIALFTWLTDEVGAAAAGNAESVDLKDYPEITMADLEKLLVPDYLPAVPKTDGWGHPFEVRVNIKNVLAEKVISIRSPGRDGELSGDVYTIGSFNPADYDQDIVWADGYFQRWPERKDGSLP